MPHSLPDATIRNPTLLNPVNPIIEDYMLTLVNHTNHPVLTAMEAFAHAHHFPIVDRLVGIFLENQARSINAKRIFEFGSGFGYSAFWFGKAVGDQGQIICTDGNADNKAKAESYLKEAKLWDRIDFYVGMAQDIFAQQAEGLFDICYNDVDKGDYPDIWQMAKTRIRPGGLYIADNVLWHGRVALKQFEDIMPGWTEAIREHNQLIFNDPDFDTFINPTRDGVLVARKKTDI